MFLYHKKKRKRTCQMSTHPTLRHFLLTTQFHNKKKCNRKNPHIYDLKKNYLNINKANKDMLLLFF